jgi:serine/threonine-protein kinase
MIGTKLAHYEITAQLGSGGMGDVYQASDTKLNREVAIKVLPEIFAHDTARMARFEREAKVLASLNHPNIAHIYGVEERALVMELVEGESPKGPMPFEDAWKIAMQIADALEYAHEKGVIHRDLKPANVKVTPDGVVKLLDFGLAKAFSPELSEVPAESRTSDSPTLTRSATIAGVILGTAAYMAPEQAKGKPVDRRADIWSWGILLYELLTGERMFKGDDTADTLAQVLTREPDLERVPPQVRKLLRRCLEKDPKQRLQAIGDARYLLEETTPSQTRHGIAAWMVATVMTAIAAAGVLVWLRTPPATPRPMMRWQVTLPDDVVAGAGVALSRDGTELVYQASGKLWVRRMDQLEALPISATENGFRPFFSPDGRWLAYFAMGLGPLKKILVAGGPPITLCNDAGFLVEAGAMAASFFRALTASCACPSRGGIARL